MTTSAQSFVSTMLNAFILFLSLPLTASQCMNYWGMKRCSFRLNVETKDLLQCMDDCLVKPGKPCTYILWKPGTKQCHVATDATFSQKTGSCPLFKKTPCNYIPGDESLQEVSGNIFKGGFQMTFVTSLEQCRAIFAVDGSSLAFTWLNERRQCIVHRRCVVLNAGVYSLKGIKVQDVNSLKACVETLLNTNSIRRIDWKWGERSCRSHDSLTKTIASPLEHVIQLRKHKGCRHKAVTLQKHENTKMSGGLKRKDLSKQECMELCQLVSNCAAVGWSDTLSECTVHLLKMSTEEDSSSTLYTVGGAGITTSTTTVSSSTEITTISTSTEATTTAPMDGTGTCLGAFFIRQDNNLLTSKSQRRSALECAMLCFRSNCSDFTSTIFNDDSVCGMSGSEPTGRSPKMQWIKL